MYSGLRSSSVFLRQIFIHLYKNALSSITYDEVLKDWLNFETAFREKWGQDALYSDIPFRRSTFKSWASTLKLTVEKQLLKAIHQVIHTRMSLSYERYVDWVVTTGIVPIVKEKEDAKLIKEIERMLLSYLTRDTKCGHSITALTKGLIAEISKIVSALSSSYIPDYAEVIIEQHGSKFSGLYRGKKVNVVVINRPITVGGTVVFDSPLQRLKCSVLACHRTQEHAKLCQLLNTSPIKAVVSEDGTGVYKDLLTKIEESSQKNDPKKELLNLLLKLAENKTVSGVTDVVEDFISDVSQNVVDKNKLFGTANSESTRQGLKKHVSGSVFKCLTNQINQQFDSINELTKERKLFLKKIELLESKLTPALLESQGRDPECIITGDTFHSLNQLSRGGDLGRSFFQLSKGDRVNNSFLSQYVPPVSEMRNELTLLWETEVLQTYKLRPVVDNQGQRLYVKYSQDTISILLGPFTYIFAGLSAVELITEDLSTVSLHLLADEIFKSSRLTIYVSDIGDKYCPLSKNELGEETISWGDYFQREGVVSDKE